MSESEKPLQIAIKRAYDKPDTSDGCRVLVDRIWPRGISKDEARLDHWMKDIAPGTALRKWFGHDPSKWDAFKKRYFQELDGQADAVASLLDLTRRETVTLVYAAKDTRYNNAAALREYLCSRAASLGQG